MITIDMEMPKNCYECPMNKGEYTPNEIEKRYCCLTHQQFSKGDYKKRPTSCPMKEFMQSEEYKRGYDAAIRHLDRYKLYRKFIRPMIVIYKNISDQLCIPAENEEKWYPEEDLDDLIEKNKHLDTVFTKLGFDEKYELLYTIRNLKEENEEK